VIVESPAKARKIGGYLGDEYIVEASIGHIRDLPQRAADIPKEVKKFAWSREGVDIENGFAPLYVINPDKKQKVQELKELLKESEELILATDEDREGEAIAWHLMEILKPKVPVKRMVFNEITKEAILKAVNETRDIDERLVDAQETRRVLDRLFGYRLSPVLWKKVMPRISAGRVQSVATRLIVERERERMAFIASSWWDLTAETDQNFNARLISVDEKRLATTNDFDSNGALKEKNASSILLLNQIDAEKLTQSLQGKKLTVKSIEDSPRTERPKPPFTTSTMQQDAGSRLVGAHNSRCASLKVCMKVATSPTCVPTQSISLKPLSTLHENLLSHSMVKTMFQIHRASMKAKLRTHKKHMKPFVPLVIPSKHLES